MPSGDGLLARVKPPGGRLPASALRAIARGARQHGNGIIELTSRGNIQIRGLTVESARHFAAAMVAAGLADPDPARESRRNVITIPPCDDARVAAIEEMLAATPGLASKFCIAVGPAEADIAVVGDTIWAEGESYAFSLETLRCLTESANGQRLHRTTLPRPLPSGLLLALPFGQTDAAALGHLAGLTNDARTTPWRALHIPEPADTSPYEAAGFITDPADPRRSIAACPGAPACASGAVPARTDALRLARLGIRDIHVSGCAKGCAHPRPALTLVGRGGRYDLIPHGRAADMPTLTGLTLEQSISHLAKS
jgi:sulfite reductase beta subunit-like hemoprotein